VGRLSRQDLSDYYRYSRFKRGHAVAQLLEALLYKSEGHGFDSRWFQLELLIDIILSAALGSTQPLTEMSTRSISWGVKAVDA
jgi:hypothetical protein